MKKFNQENKKNFGATGLLLESVNYFYLNSNLFLKITLIITLPSALFIITQQNFLNTDSSFATTIASIFLFLAIIWTYFNSSKAKKIKISDIYKKVSSYFLQSLMASVLMSIIFIPLGITLVLGFLMFTSIPNYWYFYVVPFILITFLASLLVAKYSLSYIILLKEGLSSFKSISRSGKLLKNNLLKLYFGYVIFFAVLISIYLVILYILSLNQRLAQNDLLLSTINSVVISLFLPVLIIYMCKFYEKVSSD